MWKSNLRAVVVFDAQNRSVDVKYVSDAFGIDPDTVGSCAIFAWPPAPEFAR
jgi:hypothetical protein